MVFVADTRNPDFLSWSKAFSGRFEAFAAAHLPAEGCVDAVLPEAMRYSVLGGGKRMRPLLVEAAAEFARAPEGVTDWVGLAIECVHCYSLVHDDLPCMDNDTMRRGRPTTHARYGEAQGLLAGDGLQAYAFEVLSRVRLPAGRVVRLLGLLSRAAGVVGMCGGQAIDLESVGKRISHERLRSMHALKTGALLTAAVLMGAACGDEAFLRPVADRELREYGAAVGLAFQITDDVLDVTASSEDLGKTAGKDEAEGKPTYVSMLGLEGARAAAAEQRDRALRALEALARDFPQAGSPERLAQVAEFIVRRGC